MSTTSRADGSDPMTVAWSTHAAFAAFSPTTYLEQYFTRYVDELAADYELTELLSFLAAAYRHVRPRGVLLEMGGGPTLHQVASAAHRVGEIHFADPVEANRDAVRAWLAADDAAFDWAPWVRLAVAAEGADPTPAVVRDRQAQMRRVISQVVPCDVFADQPVRESMPYDAVAMSFVLESATSDRQAWQRGLGNALGCLRPGGLLVMSALLDADYWQCGDDRFPAVRLSADELRTEVAAVAEIVELRTIEAAVPDAARAGFAGYQGMGFVAARRRS